MDVYIYAQKKNIVKKGNVNDTSTATMHLSTSVCLQAEGYNHMQIHPSRAREIKR